jgi:PTS system N-acetylglucosamine-specific IIC component
VIMDALGVKLGFGFSAGLFDYVLNYGLATRPLLLLPVGAAYFIIYYATFSWCIRRFNLATPGRETGTDVVSSADLVVGERGRRFVDALGGAANLKSVDACTTRLRLSLGDPAAIDEPALRTLGARGIVHPGGNSLQVVLGPIADQVVEEIRAAQFTAARASPDLAAAIASALQAAVIRSIDVRGSRLLVELEDSSRLSPAELDGLGTRGWVRVEGGVQLIIGPDADAVARSEFLATFAGARATPR